MLIQLVSRMCFFFLVQSDLIKVVRPCWISKLEPFNGLWRLFENEKPRGEYDAIVIAHNGQKKNSF
jgi:hypothetical protein